MKKIILSLLLVATLAASTAFAGEANLSNLAFDWATKSQKTETTGSTPLYVKYEYGIAHKDAGSLAAAASVDVTLPVETAGAKITSPNQVEIVSVSVVSTANSACRVAFYSRGARRGTAYNLDSFIGSANFNSFVADGGFFAQDDQGIIPYVNEDGNKQIEATVTNNGASASSYYITILYRY